MKNNHKNQKSGRWSVDDKKFIEENCDTMHYEDIAIRLRRNRLEVRKYIEHVLNKKTDVSKKVQREHLPIEYNIKKSPVWKELKSQFNEDELKKFLFHWKRIVTQFKEDILPTEELQIVDYIRLEILMDRLSIQQQQNLIDIQNFEAQLVQQKSLPIEQQNFTQIEMLQSLIGARRNAQGNMTKEHVALLQEKSKMLDKMRATRSERIKFAESAKDSFIGWTKKVIQDPNFREEMGRYMEKMRLAMKKEEDRLSQPYKYIDGTYDLPLLTVESYEALEDDLGQMEQRISDSETESTEQGSE